MTSLSGRLSEGALADLLQYLALTRASGCLLLRHSGRRQACVYLDGGKVVFVDARPLYDVAALGELLGWGSGEFAFREGVKAPRRTLDVPTERLLLEAARRSDERADHRSVDLDAVLTPATGERRNPRGDLPDTPREAQPARTAQPAAGEEDGPFGALRVLGAVRLDRVATGRGGPADQPAADHAPTEEDDSVSLSLPALRLWRRLDGVASLREIAAETSRPHTEVVRAGAELIEAGLATFGAVAVADRRFSLELAREAVDLLGPVGEIVVEDALYDLGMTDESVPVARVGELVEAIESAFTDLRTRAEFSRRASELRELFALEPSRPRRK